MAKNFTEIAFTPAVKAVQQRRGSRDSYRKIEDRDGWRTTLTPELRDFIAARDSIFFATANAAGQPYVQHRGGPAGFIQVLDDSTLAIADFVGNRQYVTAGNLAENDRAFIFMMDWGHQRRVKFYGRAKVVEDDPALLQQLMPEGYAATPERAIIFTIEAWDANCHQHIPRMVNLDDVVAGFERMEARIKELEEENRRLRSAANPDGASDPAK